MLFASQALLRVLEPHLPEAESWKQLIWSAGQGGVVERILASTKVSGSVAAAVVAMVPWDGYHTVERHRGSVARHFLLCKVTGYVVSTGSSLGTHLELVS